MKQQKVVVLGGGFGGIKAALDLSKDPKQRFEITLISDQDTFRYYPSLYRTATGGAVAGSSIALSDILNSSVKIIKDTAVSIDRKTKTITLNGGGIVTGDVLILSLGVVTNYFGIPGMEEYSYGIKNFDAIKRFKAHLHDQLEDNRRPDLNYVIVGAGPTGIELAGALPEYLNKIMDHHGIRHKAVHIDLIEAGPRLLPRMPKIIGTRISERLRSLGVKIYTKQAVQGVSADELTVNGKQIRSHTVVWTAGTTNHPFYKDNGFMITPRGKVVTDLYLQSDEGIYVIGDNGNTPYSGMAQTALHEGVYVAESLMRKAEGKDPKSYVIKKPITVIPVGNRWASVYWGNTKLQGVIGWLLREAADVAAFIDYEPWWKAGKQWLKGFEEEEDCLVCQRAMNLSMTDK